MYAICFKTVCVCECRAKCFAFAYKTTKQDCYPVAKLYRRAKMIEHRQPPVTGGKRMDIAELI